MQPEIGKIYDGKVKGITKYGAFVEIAEGVTGMVHISEISNTFVNEIREVLTENQDVKVKVLGITEEGKVSLSIKRTIENTNFRPQQKPRFNSNGGNYNNDNRNGGYRSNDNNNNNKRFDNRNSSHSSNNADNNKNVKTEAWGNKKTPSSSDTSFEDMLSKFKQNSEEKIGDIKRNIENKRKNTSRRGK